MNDFSLNTSYGSLKDEVLLIIQQLDILFDTNQGDVLGDENFGTQYDKYLHNLKISNEGLRHEVMSDLSTLELFGWVPEVEVYLFCSTKASSIYSIIFCTAADKTLII